MAKKKSTRKARRTRRVSRVFWTIWLILVLLLLALTGFMLLANPDVADKIEADVRANAHKLMTPQARKAAVAAGRAIDISADDFEG